MSTQPTTMKVKLAVPESPEGGHQACFVARSRHLHDHYATDLLTQTEVLRITINENPKKAKSPGPAYCFKVTNWSSCMC